MAVQNDLCNAKGAQPASPRPLPAGLPRSPAHPPAEVGQPPREARERKVPDPEAPTPIATTDPNAVCGRLNTGPASPKPLATGARRQSLGSARHQSKGPGCALPSNCRGAPRTAAGQRGGENDREEGGAGGLGSTYFRQESASSRGREGTASRLRKRPRDAPPRSAAFPRLLDSPASIRPPPSAQERILDTLPAAFRGTQTLPRLPTARATGGSLGLQQRRVWGLEDGQRRRQAPSRMRSPLRV